MAREMYLVGVTAEELQPDPKPEKPKTPKAKWDNFWYHYKWLTIGAVFVAAVLAVLIGQMASRNDPDYTLLLVTEKPYTSDMLSYMEKELAKYGEDIDGDGTVEVRIINSYLGSDGTNSQQNLSSSQVLQVHLISGDVMLFAFEPAQYEWLVTNALNEEGAVDQFFTRLDTGSAGLSEGGVAWNWAGDSRVTEDLFLSKMPEDLYFTVRTAAGITAKNEEMHRQCLDLLMAFIENRPTATE